MSTKLATLVSKTFNPCPIFQNIDTLTSMLQVRKIQSEVEAWKRTLGFLREENVFLKEHLSEVLKESAKSSLLEALEVFQTRFVREDERIALLRNDIADLDRLLIREVYEDGAMARQLAQKTQELRVNMRITEQEFSRLKSEFHQYLETGVA